MRKSLVLLGILDDTDVEWMIRVGSKRSIPAGTTLIHEGKTIDSLFIVLQGAFEITIAAQKGKVIANLMPGEILGEMSFIDSRPPSATVTASQDSLVLDIGRAEVNERLQEELAFQGRFYRSLAVLLSLRLRDTVATFGYGKQPRLDEKIDDGDEISEDILDAVSLAGMRFGMLQDRTRSVGYAV